MSKAKKFLESMLFDDGRKYFGIKDEGISTKIADIWHDDIQNLNGRWSEIEKYNDHEGKILDMACGVGTFLFYGLRKGYDVYGIEPEQWKIDYMNMKIDELDYPQEWKSRVIQGVGEKLPFEHETFDYIGTYQTLEHVQNLEQCLDELIRVLKVGGRMKIQAPDYDSFFEPHYMLPFFPKMNKRMAEIYLGILGRPILGLNTLTWITAKRVKTYLDKYKQLQIIDLYLINKERKIMALQKKYYLPKIIANLAVDILFYSDIYLCKQEKQISIIIKKEP